MTSRTSRLCVAYTSVDTGANDRLEPAGIVEEIGGDLRLAAHDDTVGGADGFLEGVALEAVALVEFDAGLAQDVKAGGFQFVADQNTRHDSLDAC